MTNISPIRCAPERRRRKLLKAYNVLGDVSDYQAKLQALEQPREPTPPPEPFDLSCVPHDVLAAMNSDTAVYKPMLEAFKSIFTERKALADEHVRVRALAPTPSLQTQPLSSASLEATRDSRTLAKHQALEQAWATQSVNLAAQYGKQPAETTLARAFSFRKRREKLDHIHKSKPVYERVSSDVFWQISLREAYSRYLQIGHEFSGLYVHTEEKPPEQMRVPLEIFGKPAAIDPSRGPVAAALIERLGLQRRRLLRSQEAKGRAWLQGSYLRTVEKKYKKPMSEMMAHMPETDELAVLGCSAVDSLAAQAARPVMLEEVLARLAKTAPEVAERYKSIAAEAREREAAAAAAALQEAQDALAAHHAAAGPVGPALRFSAERLVLLCAVGEMAVATLRVRGVGTAAVRYRWACATPGLPVPGAQRSGSAGDHAVGSAAAMSPFLMCRWEGAVLPGQELEFEFLFRPQREGMYTEVWTMEVRPALIAGFAVPPVTLRGVAVAHDSNALHRGRLSRSLLESCARREAAAVLERLLLDLTAPAAALPDLPDQLAAEHAAFAAAVAGEDPPLFFREGLGRRLAEADGRVRELVGALGEAVGGKGKKGGSRAAPQEVEQALTEHDGSLVSLERLLVTIQEHAPDPAVAAAAAEVAQEMITLRAEAAAPDSVTVLNAHVARKLLLAAAEAGEAAAATALQASVDSFERRRAADAEAEALEEQLTEVPAPALAAPPAAGKKGKADKGALLEETPPKPEFDTDVYNDLLYRGMRESLRRSLNGWEGTMEETLEQVGAVLDARIAEVQVPARARGSTACAAPDADGLLKRGVVEAPPQEAAADGAAAAAGEARAWAVFALLRQRAALSVRSAAPGLTEAASVLRQAPLDFGDRVEAARNVGGASTDMRHVSLKSDVNPCPPGGEGYGASAGLRAAEG
eukprot:jgi/Ulvmu1/6350/UM029_0058.1